MPPHGHPSTSGAHAYQRAADLLAQNKATKCIAAATKNILNRGTSAYHMIKNILLIVEAEIDWGDAEGWRVYGETAYAQLVPQSSSDTMAQALLLELREHLDDLSIHMAKELKRIEKLELAQTGVEVGMKGEVGKEVAREQSTSVAGLVMQEDSQMEV